MKKLMVAFAAVAMAAVANAAATTWGVEYIEYSDESTVDQGGYYWILSLGTATDVSGISVSKTGVLSTTYDTKVDKTAWDSPDAVGGSMDLVAGDANKYFALVVWDGADKFGVSDATQAIVDQSDPLTFKDMNLNNGLDTDEYTVVFLNQNATAVPEPTSGLLLLLGMAGLALRRRRA